MLFVLFVWKGAPLGASVTPIRAKGGVLFMRSQFPTPRARQAFTPFYTKTEGHTCSALGSSTQGEWQSSTTHPRAVPGRSVISYSKVIVSSMAGMCENAIMSAGSHLSVLMMGWLWRMLNLACWKQGHSLSKWANVSGSSSQSHLKLCIVIILFYHSKFSQRNGRDVCTGT